ncbi:PDZ domain-containing protein [Nonlabens marinus]|nr:PDZ domain-containing protein [Nonlabens marinus]
MYRVYSLLIIICLGFISKAQDSYKFPPGTDQIEIPFQSAYNLIVLPVKVNGVELNMILDTGASKSIIFNLSGIDSLQVNKGNLLVVEGYGKGKTFSAYYSEGNTLDVNGYENKSANIFVAAEREIDLLPTLGFEVHGLLSTQFFQDALVEVDYLSREVILYKNPEAIKYKTRSMRKVPITFVNGKPYTKGFFRNGSQELPADLLIDLGSGDALWLLDIPENFMKNNESFEDYLGFGMNGEVSGTRSKMDQLIFGNYQLNRLTTSQPGEGQFVEIIASEVEKSYTGSVGGEVLSRFDVIFDYARSILYLRPNDEFKYGFFYNMAGINIVAGEKELFTTVTDDRNRKVRGVYRTLENEKTISTSKQYSYSMVPRLFVNYVRPESPADLAGVQEGDEILKLNGVSKGNLTLDNTSSKFFKNPYSKIKLKVKRGEKELKFNFRLIPVIK